MEGYFQEKHVRSGVYVLALADLIKFAGASDLLRQLVLPALGVIKLLYLLVDVHLGLIAVVQVGLQAVGGIRSGFKETTTACNSSTPEVK